ncbi:MAG: hypothetical protein HFE28_01090 [Clostridia bacterium]|jgi:hypothetical protein|nr:hypothetical protein [Clostridia bacterium]
MTDKRKQNIINEEIPHGERGQTPTAEEFNARITERCATCEIKEWALDNDAARAACDRCNALLQQLKKTYLETAQDGKNAAAGISPTRTEERQEGGTDAPETADNVELFNLMNGAAFLPRSERDAHPNAEYFTAEISPEHVGKVLEGLESDEVKSVTLTFRKLVTVKDGEIVDITKSGEKVKAVAIEDGGKMFLRVGAAAMGENVVGVLVRIAISLKGVKE